MAEVGGALRLRLAAERAAGAHVVVSRDDLLEALDIPVQRALDLDALGGEPGPEPAAEVATFQPPPGRGRRHIVLAPSIEDAKQLARAAWDTCPERVAEHGRFDVAEPGPTWATVLAALATLEALAAR